MTHTVLVPTMINLLTQFPDAKKYDLSSLQVLAYGGSPMAPKLVHRTRELLPTVKLIQVYGLSETGFLTGLQDHEHTEDKLISCDGPVPVSIFWRATFRKTSRSGTGRRTDRTRRQCHAWLLEQS